MTWGIDSPKDSGKARIFVDGNPQVEIDTAGNVRGLGEGEGGASETDAGLSRVATQSQTDAGVIDTRFVTPRKMRWGVAYSLGNNGYVILPSWLGRFIIQWGSYINTNGSTVRNYPIPFTQAVYALIPTATNYGSDTNLNAVPISRSGSGFNINTYSGGTITKVSCEVDYIAIGR